MSCCKIETGCFTVCGIASSERENFGFCFFFGLDYHFIATHMLISGHICLIVRWVRLAAVSPPRLCLRDKQAIEAL